MSRQAFKKKGKKTIFRMFWGGKNPFKATFMLRIKLIPQHEPLQDLKTILCTKY